MFFSIISYFLFHYFVLFVYHRLFSSISFRPLYACSYTTISHTTSPSGFLCLSLYCWWLYARVQIETIKKWHSTIVAVLYAHNKSSTIDQSVKSTQLGLLNRNLFIFITIVKCKIENTALFAYNMTRITVETAFFKFWLPAIKEKPPKGLKFRNKSVYL